MVDRGWRWPTSPLAGLCAHRLLPHLSFRSVWFRNAVRGAVGLAIAVTGGRAHQRLTRLLGGAGDPVGAAVQCPGHGRDGAARRRRYGRRLRGRVADHDRRRRPYGSCSGCSFPLAVLVSGIAPSMISFAAGQAAFTVVVVILFNIIEPLGWKVGLTRIEDVAIGCGVSIVVGLPLLAPVARRRRSGAPCRDAFVASSGYLADAVDRLTTTQRARRHRDRPAGVASCLPPARRRLPAVLRRTRGEGRLDGDHSRLFTGSNRLRLAAYTLARCSVQPSGRRSARARVRRRRRGGPA